MEQSKQQRIRELTDRLNRCRYEYYNLNAPSLTDAEYDALFDELSTLEKQTGFSMTNSPTQTVGCYTTDEAMGHVWSLVAFTKDAFKEKFGDADLATVIGVESYVLGSDSDYIYLLVRPSDVQFLENDDTSLKQYKQLQQESQVVLAGFLKDNSITVNEDCPNSSCYKVAHGTNK